MVIAAFFASLSRKTQVLVKLDEAAGSRTRVDLVDVQGKADSLQACGLSALDHVAGSVSSVETRAAVGQLA